MTETRTKKANRLLPLIAVLVTLLFMLSQSFYIVQEQEQAVVLTFGSAKVTDAPGPHFKLPFVQKVYHVPMLINGFYIGYDITNNTVPYESIMITSDYNIVNVDFFLEYRVSDPERYLFASDDPVFIMRNLALSYIRDTIGLHTVDEVITTGKSEIQAEIKEKLIRRLEEEDLGLQLVNITIQDAEPPTMEVISAFKDVETAKQGKDTAINNARQYESERLPAARAQVDAILKNAEAQRETRINEGKAQVAVFNAMYEEYAKNPAMTKRRMFYEAMEELLPGLKIIIDDGTGTNKILPIESFTGAQ